MQKSQIIKKILRFFILIFSFWLCFSVILFLSADEIIFLEEYSQGKPKSKYIYEEIFIPYDKKEELYLIKSFTKKSDNLVILFFHGNAGGIGRVINALTPYYNVVAPSYPSYHLSTGKPNEEGLYKTVDLSIKYLNQIGIKNENIVVFGASLGGTPALYAAKNYPDLRKVILVGSFDSAKSVCKDRYSIFCVFAGNILNNNKLALETKASISLFHSPNDRVVKFKHGKNLFKNISSPDKEFHEISEGHNNFIAVDLIEKSLKK